MVGIVIVSHSRRLAEGIEELVQGMAGGEVPLAVTGGTDDSEEPLGTDATAVLEAIEDVYSEDGVLVLMDLGSAVLSAEMAVDMLDGDRRGLVLLCEAPLVEGAMAAVVQARMGATLEEVAAEARSALGAKRDHLAPPEDGRGAASAEADRSVREDVDAEHTLRLTIENELGLHARPAVRFVETVGRFDTDLQVSNLTTGKGPASGRSLNAIATLGVRQGHEVLVEARGPESQQALDALANLAEQHFGESIEAPASAAPAAGSDQRPGDRRATAPGELLGLAAAPGIAVAPARLVGAPELEVGEEQPEDPEEELAALDEAIAAVREEIAATRASVEQRSGAYQAGIFDAHRLFLEDEALLEPTRRSITEEGSSAAAAWQRAVASVVEDYRSLDDAYLRARAEDVEAVGRQVLARLLGSEAAPTLREPGVVVASNLTPAETAGLDREFVEGIATAYGSPTSHSAILARGLGVPAVVGLGDELLRVAEGTRLVLSGDDGVLLVDPDEEVVADHEDRQRRRKAELEEARATAHEPAVTRDGHEVEVAANVGDLEQATEALEAGADAIGLLRTEFLFLDRDSPPDEDEQVSVYEDICAAMGGRPVVLRTLDVGGDKPVPGIDQPEEANPFLGLRAIRLSLTVPDLFETQLRAALRVARRHPLRIMFPMVTTIEELRAARGALEDASDTLGEGRDAPAEEVQVGVMVEVPALALIADRVADEVDFLSIGTNDLAQYTFAAERGNPDVAALADPFHPALLRLIRRVVEAGRSADSWVGLCGEMAADPDAAVLLVGLGVGELSMNPAAIPTVKRAIRGVERADAEELADRALELESAAAVRDLLTEFRA